MFSLNRKMLLGIVVLITLCSSALAQTAGHGYDLVDPKNAVIPKVLEQQISISLEKVRYEDALNAIADSGKIQLNYNQSKIPLNTLVSIREKKITVINALIYLMKVTNTRLLITEKAQLIVVPVPEKDRKRASISGKIKKNGDGSPIPLVNITIVGMPRGASTDLEGNYKIPVLPYGIYSLEVKCLGYETKIIEDIRLDSELGQVIDVALKPSVYSLKEITVTPGSFAFMESNTSAQKTMDREDIESVGQLGEDIYRAIKRLPGLSSGDFSAKFTVRGGNNDETLVLLDGLELYEPFHMKDFNEGALSILDVEAIEGVELMTGGFTAEYGNKTSGVLNFSSRKPNGHNTYGLGISLMNMRAMSEGSFNQGKGSWFVSARRGYMDMVFDMMGESDIPSPTYYDSFFKLSYQIHPKHRLSANVLHAGDQLRMHADDSEDYGDPTHNLKVKSEYLNSYFWINLNSAFSSDLVAETVFSFSSIINDRYGRRYEIDDPSVIDFRIDGFRDFAVFNFKQDWMYDFSDRMLFKAGIDYKTLATEYKYDGIDHDEEYDPDSGTFIPVTHRNNYKVNKDGITYGAYLSNRIRVLDPLTCELGLRYDHADYSNDGDLSPRVNAALRLAEHSYLRAGWGTYRQMQGLQDLYIEDGDNKFYPSEKATQWTAGLEHFFNQNTHMRLEGYYKRSTELAPAQRNWRNGMEFFPEIQGDRILVYPDEIISKGVELYVSKTFSPKFSINGSYALAYVDETINKIEDVNGELPTSMYDKDHSHPNDQRHTLNLETTYKPNSKWSINLSYAFHTGWPNTVDSFHRSVTPDGKVVYTQSPSKIYNDRLPSYQRLDMRVTRRIKTKNGDLRLFAEVINLTNHNNVYGQTYDIWTDDDGNMHAASEKEKWFGLLPSIGVSWTGNLGF